MFVFQVTPFLVTLVISKFYQYDLTLTVGTWKSIPWQTPHFPYFLYIIFWGIYINKYSRLPFNLVLPPLCNCPSFTRTYFFGSYLNPPFCFSFKNIGWLIPNLPGEIPKGVTHLYILFQVFTSASACYYSRK